MQARSPLHAAAAEVTQVATGCGDSGRRCSLLFKFGCDRNRFSTAAASRDRRGDRASYADSELEAQQRSCEQQRRQLEHSEAEQQL
eukprot:SAG11_NODE_816_length_7030_cov_15.673784_1_plen_86_part_00